MIKLSAINIEKYNRLSNARVVNSWSSIYGRIEILKLLKKRYNLKRPAIRIEETIKAKDSNLYSIIFNICHNYAQRTYIRAVADLKTIICPP